MIKYTCFSDHNVDCLSVLLYERSRVKCIITFVLTGDFTPKTCVEKPENN